MCAVQPKGWLEASDEKRLERLLATQRKIVKELKVQLGTRSIQCFYMEKV